VAGNFAALMRRFAREGAQMIDPAASAARASGRTPANHDLAANAAGQFQLDQAGEELDMVQLLGGALAGQILVFAHEGRQLQRLLMSQS